MGVFWVRSRRLEREIYDGNAACGTMHIPLINGFAPDCGGTSDFTAILVYSHASGDPYDAH